MKISTRRNNFLCINSLVFCAEKDRFLCNNIIFVNSWGILGYPKFDRRLHKSHNSPLISNIYFRFLWSTVKSHHLRISHSSFVMWLVINNSSLANFFLYILFGYLVYIVFLCILLCIDSSLYLFGSVGFYKVYPAQWQTTTSVGRQTGVRLFCRISILYFL